MTLSLWYFGNIVIIAVKDALMEMLDWHKDLLPLKVVLRSARVTDGALCVIMDGKDQILKWCVNNLDYLQQVLQQYDDRVIPRVKDQCIKWTIAHQRVYLKLCFLLF